MTRRKQKDEGIVADTNPQEPECEETPNIADEERYRIIAETAYLIAEQRSFQGDGQLDDWLRAESEVNECLAQGLVKVRIPPLAVSDASEQAL